MAYNVPMLEKVIAYMQAARSNLFLGYPDIIVPIDEARKVFPNATIRPGVLSESWRMKRDGTPLPPMRLANSDDLLDQLEVKERMYVDVNAHRECEVYADLNVPTDLGRRWGAVHEMGTLEHLASPWQGVQFMHTHAEVGGFLTILQQIGVKKNHGFFEIQPNFFLDLERANRKLLRLVAGGVQIKKFDEEGTVVERRDSMSETHTPGEFLNQFSSDFISLTYVLVLKKKAEGLLEMPIQKRYATKHEMPLPEDTTRRVT